MIQVTRFEIEHANVLLSYKGMEEVRLHVKPHHLENLRLSGNSYSLLSDERVIACGGVAEYWKNRAEAWVIFAPDYRRYAKSVHRAAKHFLETCPYRRIEAAVDVGFHAGHRWAKALGFKLENPCARAYQQNGRDSAIYAIVREE